MCVFVCFCHVLFVSRVVCVTCCLCHVLFVPRVVCVTCCLCHVLFVSRVVCVTRCLCHVLFVSRVVCVTCCLCHVLCCFTEVLLLPKHIKLLTADLTIYVPGINLKLFFKSSSLHNLQNQLVFNFLFKNLFLLNLFNLFDLRDGFCLSWLYDSV